MNSMISPIRELFRATLLPSYANPGRHGSEEADIPKTRFRATFVRKMGIRMGSRSSIPPIAPNQSEVGFYGHLSRGSIRLVQGNWGVFRTWVSKRSLHQRYPKRLFIREEPPPSDSELNNILLMSTPTDRPLLLKGQALLLSQSLPVRICITNGNSNGQNSGRA